MAKKKKAATVPRLMEEEFVVFDREETRIRYQKLVELEGGMIQEQVDQTTTLVLHYKYSGTDRTVEKAAKARNKKGGSIQIEDARDYFYTRFSDHAWFLELCEQEEVERFAEAAKFGNAAMTIEGIDFKKSFPPRTQLHALLNFRNCSFDGLDFHEDIHFGTVEHCSFKKTNLGAGCLVRALQSCDLSNCKGTLLVSGELKDCIVDGLQIEVRKIEGSSLVGCSIPSEYWHDVRSSNLNRAKIPTLSHTRFADSSFEQASFFSQEEPQQDRVTAFGEDLVNRSLYYLDHWTDIHAATCNFKGMRFPKCGAVIRSSFTNCNLSKASFAGLQLCDISFANCDLRGANFKGTRLHNVNFAGSNVKGADFTGAVMQNGSINDLGLNGAKGLQEARSLDHPALITLAKYLEGHATYQTTVLVETEGGEELTFEAKLDWSRGNAQVPGTSGAQPISMDFVHQTMMPLYAFGELFSVKAINDGSLKVKSTSSPVKGKALKLLLLQAWHAALGLEVMTEEEAKQAAEAKRKAASSNAAKTKAKRKVLLALLDGTAKGVKAWNKQAKEVEAAGAFKNAAFEGAALNEATFFACPESNFAKAQLKKARFAKGSFRKTRFDGAQLEAATFAGCDLKQARFIDANLAGATFRQASLLGVDFTGADLTKAVFKGCAFDEGTVWPKGFEVPTSGLKWEGKGADPSKLAALEAAAKKGKPIDFATFMENVSKQVDLSRLHKALRMLKRDSFQLFVEASDEGISGVVKSQTDASLVYSCRITASGEFCCCTQNLNTCGGLRGALCKHLLVLIFGIANDESVDTSALDLWVEKSTIQSPNLNKDAMSAVLLKYKGAEAGEIDWRPTETVPEDYYAF